MCLLIQITHANKLARQHEESHQLALLQVSFKPNTLRRRRRDETVESRRVGSVNTPPNLSAVVTQFTTVVLTTDK